MAIKRRTARMAYGMGDNLITLAPEPVVAQRAPTTSDVAQPGTIWLNQAAGGDDVYILLEVAANSASWVACGSGDGVFDSLTSTTTLTVGTTVTLSGLSRGVVQSSAAGVLSSSEGADGELLIGSSAGAPAWAAITSGDGSVVITNGNNTIDLQVSGAAASTFPTDAGTATPALGATTITGGTNVNTAGAADVVTINVDNAPTFSGLVTAQAGITQSAGTLTVTSDTDAADAIYLHADAGTNETIHLHSDQGTGVDSINLESDVGGITLSAVGLASNDAINLSAAAGGVDVDAALQLNLASSQNAANAIVLNASAGGIDITSSGGAGEDIDISTSSSINLVSTEDVAEAIYLHANAGTSETIHIHADQGTAAASVYVHSDVGGVTLDAGLASDDAINLVASNGGVDIDGAMQVNIASSESAADALVLEASAGGIDILASGAAAGEDIDIAATGSSVNISSSEAVADAITLNASDAAGGIDITAGTGDIDISASGNVNVSSTLDAADAVYLHANGGTSEKIRVHADQGTAADSVSLVSDDGGLTLSAGLATDDAINLSASAGGVDVDAALQLNLASSEAAADAVVVSASDSAGGIQLNSSGDIPQSIYLHADAGTSEKIRIHADQGTAVDSVSVESDVGGLTLSSGLASDDAINVSASAGGVDVDAALQVNIASSEAAADAVVIDASDASGGVQITASGGGAILLDTNSLGDIALTPATNSAAATSLTLNAKIGVGTFTGQTTAAGAQETFTITNSEVSAGSGMLVTVTNVGTNDARMTLERVKSAAGSFEVMTQNNGGAALNGDVIISWVVLN